MKVSNEALTAALPPAPNQAATRQVKQRTQRRSWAKDRVLPMLFGALGAGVLILSGVAFIEPDVPPATVGVSY